MMLDRDFGAKNIFRPINYERRQTFQMALAGSQKDYGAGGIILKIRPNKIGDYLSALKFQISTRGVTRNDLERFSEPDSTQKGCVCGTAFLAFLFFPHFLLSESIGFRGSVGCARGESGEKIRRKESRQRACEKK